MKDDVLITTLTLHQLRQQLTRMLP